MDTRGGRICTIIVIGLFLQAVSGCGVDTVLTALETCRDERQSLNTVAARHDTNQSHVCTVFQAFARCMDPQIGECKGETIEAYHTQREIYTGPLYNCTVISSADHIKKSTILVWMSLLTALFFKYS